MNEDNLTPKPVKQRGNVANLKPFKKGFDPRRWLGGRGKKSPEQREGEKILLAVIWEELSREFDARSGKPLDNPETIDALRLMVRQWIKKKPELIAERIAGKVTERHDVNLTANAEIGVRFVDYRTGIAPPPSRPGGDNTSSREDEGIGDGA